MPADHPTQKPAIAQLIRSRCEEEEAAAKDGTSFPSWTEPVTRPCEFCGVPVTKTGSQAYGRNYWTCGSSCSNRMRYKAEAEAEDSPNPHRGKRDTRPCAVCGKPVTRYLNPVNIDRQWTCSQACKGVRIGERNRKQIEAGTWIRPVKPRRGAEVPCPTCGTPTYKKPHLIAEGLIYCSKACFDVAQTQAIIKPCAGCGKEMKLKPSMAAQGYCSKDCESDANILRPVGRMHNGRPARYDASGYVLIWEPDHPNLSQKGWQYEHRFLAEKSIGRFLKSDEHVHHINGIKDDNRPENLQVMDARDHLILTGIEKRADLAAKLAELEAYRRLYGPLPDSDPES